MRLSKIANEISCFDVVTTSKQRRFNVMGRMG